MEKMTLKQVFVQNLKEFRKKEGFSQMKLAEHCNTAHSYIGEIEVGRKFPSMEMIEKLADILRIKPYLFFIDRTEANPDIDPQNIYPKLPKSMKSEIKAHVNSTVIEGINQILDRY